MDESTRRSWGSEYAFSVELKCFEACIEDEKMIEISDFGKDYGDFTAVECLNLNIA